MSEMILHKKQAKPLFSNHQKTFNRLRKKVENLQKELQSVHRELDQLVFFHYEQIQPVKNGLFNALKDFVRIMYGFYQEMESLSRKERKKLKEFILSKINQLFGFSTSLEIDPDIIKIFEDLEEVDFEELKSEQLHAWKEEVSAKLEEEGIDIDLSDIEHDDVQGFQQKVFEAMEEAKSRLNEEPFAEQKTTKQTQKEIRAQELAALQKKGLSTIYKELAKIFHPDLVQTAEEKSEKEGLMKRLTCAYKDNDLFTLLSLKMEWMRQSGDRGEAQSDDQLKVYNAILKDQAKSIQENIEHAFLHPKYVPLRRYFCERVQDIPFILQHVQREIKDDLGAYQRVIKDLQGKDGEEILRDILRGY